MLPIRLSMSAFGPFPETETIDFTALGKNPLFLINGPTGSGKTTILDGICYALYGETTGNEREGRDMRCDYALEKQLTEIELLFELSGSHYRIHRLPEQQRPKSRGDGFTTQKPAAQLWRIEGEKEVLVASQRVSDVNHEIIQLTGLSAEQFRQVMVLPQGKFRDLLLAPSEDREKIFKQLFQTHIYTRLQDKLREQANALKSAVTKQNVKVEAVLEGLEMESLQQLNEQISIESSALQVKKNTQIETEKSWSLTQKALSDGLLLDQQFAEYQQAMQQYQTLQNQLPQIDDKETALKLAHQAQAIDALYQELQRQHKDLKQTQAQLEKQQKIQEKAQQNLNNVLAAKQAEEAKADDLEDLKRQINDLSSYRQRSQQLQQASIELQKTQKSWKKSQQIFQQAEIYYQQQLLDRQNMETDIQQLREKVAPLGQALLQFEKLQQQLTSHQKHHVLQQQQGQLQTQYQAADKNFQALDEKFEKQKRQLQVYQQAWQNGQAALLAKQLEADTACPVCGSLEHPNPAHGDENIPTEKELEQLSKKLEQLTSQREKAKTALDSLSKDLEANQQRIQELATECDLSLDNQNLQQDCLELKQQIELMQKQQVLIPSQEQFDKKKQQENLSLEKKTTSQEALSQLQAQVLVCENQVLNCQSELPQQYQDNQKLESDISQLQLQVTAIQENQKRLNERYQQAEKDNSAAQANLELIQIRLQETEQIQQKGMENWNNTLQQSPFASESIFLAAKLPTKQLSQLEQEIRLFKDQLLMAKTGLNEKQQKIKDCQAPELEKLKQQEADARLEKEQADSAYYQAVNYLKTLNSNYENIHNSEKEKQKLEEKFQIIGTLSDISNGKNPHNLSLQRFVLSVLLDDVLLEAGQRLTQMSKGRYRLLRKEAVGDRRSKAGLDLEVEDAYTGKLRPVATLSGGESFMAALSLALGLSDVVQAYAGGIRLDTLFVDEGFGSLDPESLDLAINTLIDLQKSGRMVGIISHVPELKERIDVRIDLRVDKKGSQAALYLP